MTDQTTETAHLEPAAEYTPDWPAIVNRLSAELDEEREACRAWRKRAETAEAVPPADRAAVLTAAERQFLRFALDLAFDRMVSDDGFTDEDEAALASLRRMAAETQPAACSCGVLRAGPGRHLPECPNRPAAERQDGAQP